MPQKPSKNKFKSHRLVWGGLFFAATTAGLASLGVWQLKRADWKQGLVAQSQTFMALPEQVFTPNGAYPQWQRVIVEGQFDLTREAVLESQLGPNDTPGYRIVTPLVVGKHEVLIDRGWIPRSFATDFLQQYTPQTNRFTAVVREFPQHHGWLKGPTESYGAAKTLVFFDPIAIPQIQDVERLGYYLQATSPTNANVQAFVTTPAQSITPERHREYALTWFSCAVLWLLCGGYYGVIALRAPKLSAPRASGRKGPKSATRRGK